MCKQVQGLGPVSWLHPARRIVNLMDGQNSGAIAAGRVVKRGDEIRAGMDDRSR